jgi:hypothetical protein
MAVRTASWLSAGAEHHRDPGHGAELRLLLVRAELDAAVLAGREPENEDHEEAGRQHEEPAGVLDHPALRRRRHRAEARRADEAPDDEAHREGGRDTEHETVEAGVLRRVELDRSSLAGLQKAVVRIVDPPLPGRCGVIGALVGAARGGEEAIAEVLAITEVQVVLGHCGSTSLVMMVRRIRAGHDPPI